MLEPSGELFGSPWNQLVYVRGELSAHVNLRDCRWSLSPIQSVSFGSSLISMDVRNSEIREDCILFVLSGPTDLSLLVPSYFH